MKKGLRKTLIILETVFILLAAFGAALLIWGLFSIYFRTYGNAFAAANIKTLCVAFAAEIFNSVLMILSLHIFIGISRAADPMHSVLHKICLGTAAAANLFFYIISFLVFIMKYGVGVPLQITVALWLLCVIACIASMIAVGVNALIKDIQNRRKALIHTVLHVFKKCVSWPLIVLTPIMICISAFLSMMLYWDVDFASYASDFYTVERCLHREFGKNVKDEDGCTVAIDDSNEVYVYVGKEKEINLQEGEREAFARIRNAFKSHGHDHSAYGLIIFVNSNRLEFSIPEVGINRLVYSPDPILIEVSKGYIKYGVFPVGLNWYYLEKDMQIAAIAIFITAILFAADIVLICIKLYEMYRAKHAPASEGTNKQLS